VRQWVLASLKGPDIVVDPIMRVTFPASARGSALSIYAVSIYSILWLAFARDHNICSVPMFGLRNSLTTDFYRTKMKGPDRPKRY
jgi:hypothetical protein